MKVRLTKGPSIVQSTLTLPSPGAVLNTNKDSVSPVIYTKQLFFFLEYKPCVCDAHMQHCFNPIYTVIMEVTLCMSLCAAFIFHSSYNMPHHRNWCVQAFNLGLGFASCV